MLDDYVNQQVRITVRQLGREGREVVVAGQLLAFKWPFLKIRTPQAVRIFNVYTVREITPTKQPAQMQTELQ